jgi:hypothetical protein
MVVTRVLFLTLVVLMAVAVVQALPERPFGRRGVAEFGSSRDTVDFVGRQERLDADGSAPQPFEFNDLEMLMTEMVRRDEQIRLKVINELIAVLRRDLAAPLSLTADTVLALYQKYSAEAGFPLTDEVAQALVFGDRR